MTLDEVKKARRVSVCRFLLAGILLSIMASFFPLISEILPMIMPAATHVTRAGDLEPKRPTVEGPVTVRAAIVDKCDRMSATG